LTLLAEASLRSDSGRGYSRFVESPDLRGEEFLNA
jgi:hypothetical protein